LTFTDATARTWQQIVLGWVLHRGRATVTGIFRTLGKLADRHWTACHKFFHRAAWSLDTLSAYLMARVIGPMILESGLTDARTGRPVADLNIDDTTAGRYGKHVAHAGWFKDASASGPATKGTVIHWPWPQTIRQPRDRPPATIPSKDGTKLCLREWSRRARSTTACHTCSCLCLP